MFPLLIGRRRGQVVHRRSIPFFTYFAGIGLGFLLIEVSLLQRLSIFLGHPTYGLTVVAVLDAGLQRHRQHVHRALPATERRASLLAPLLVLLGIVLVHGFVAPRILEATDGATTPVRIATAVAILAPARVHARHAVLDRHARRVRARPETPTAFLWAVNGAASVCASVLGVVIAALLRDLGRVLGRCARLRARVRVDGVRHARGEPASGFSATHRIDVPNGTDHRPTSDRSSRVRPAAALSMSSDVRSSPSSGPSSRPRRRVAQTGGTSQLKTCVTMRGRNPLASISVRRLGPRVAPHVAEELVGAAPQPRVRGNVDDEATARREHAPRLSQRDARLGEMLEHVEEAHDVDLARAERKALDRRWHPVEPIRRGAPGRRAARCPRRPRTRAGSQPSIDVTPPDPAPTSTSVPESCEPRRGRCGAAQWRRTPPCCGTTSVIGRTP